MTETSALPIGSRLFPPPTRLDWVIMILIALVAVIEVPAVVYLNVAKGFGDVQVFFRAGWAILTDYSIYNVTDHHGWSYHYTPFFALAMAPFADPMPGFAQPAWSLPFAASIAVWAILSMAAFALAVHLWAKALERFAGVTVAPGTGNPWVAIRFGPVLAVLPIIINGISRGQPTALLILLMTGFLILYAERRTTAAAVLLSLATAIKLFPIALALIPFLRGDLRTLLLTFVFTALLLFALPAAILGSEQTIALYSTLWDERLSGFIGGEIAENIRSELSPWPADMVAVGAILARYGGMFGQAAQGDLPAWTKLIHYAFAVALVGLTVGLGHGRFWRLGRQQPDEPYAILISGSLLVAILPAVIPVAQVHYWAQMVPLVAVLVVESWRRAGQIVMSGWLVTLGVLAWLAYIVTDASFLGALRYSGSTTMVMLIYIAVGLVALARSPRHLADNAAIA